MTRFVSRMALVALLTGAVTGQQAVAQTSGRTADVRMASVTTAAVPANDIVAATRAVENYFNTLTTLQAKFTQKATGEAFTQEGTFYLKQPRQFLWQYETPGRQKIVSTGTAVYFVDGERGQVTQLPVNSGLARFFKSDLSLRKAGLRVTGTRSTSRELRVTMVADKAEENAPKNVVLTFDRVGRGLQLRQVEALDALGVTTTVTLSQVRTGMSLPKSLFEFTPPQYREN